MNVSLIIPTHNKLALLRRTLASLAAQTVPRSEFEVIVIDDGCTDDTPAFLAGYAGPLALRAVRNEANRGRAAARNAGLRVAGGELIVFLDDDMEVVPQFLEAHRLFHAEGDRVGVGNVVNAPEITDSPIVRYMSTRGAQKIGERGDLPWKYFSTNNSSVRRRHLEQVGFFDEEFRTYGFEDLELGYRLHVSAGLSLGFVGMARSLHIHYHDIEDVLNKKFLSGRSSLAIMFRKHPNARRLMGYHRYQSPRLGDPPGLFLTRVLFRLALTRPLYLLVKPFSRFDWGVVSDRIFDFLVLYQTIAGLRLAEAELAAGLTPMAAGSRT